MAHFGLWATYIQEISATKFTKVMTFPKKNPVLQTLQPQAALPNLQFNGNCKNCKFHIFSSFCHICSPFVMEIKTHIPPNDTADMHNFFHLYPWEALRICSSIFIILLEIYRFKLLKLPKNFVVANQFLIWICRLKSDYDDVVKKNQELENRILQLVMLLPFWSIRRPLIHDWNENFWHFLPPSSTGFQ